MRGFGQDKMGVWSKGHKLWDNVFWSDSYCLITTGEVTLEQLKKYVESQGENDEC